MCSYVSIESNICLIRKDKESQDKIMQKQLQASRISHGANVRTKLLKW